MIDYSRVNTLAAGSAAGRPPFAAAIAFLVEAWADAYARTTPSPDIVETTCGGFSYLFDVRGERLVAAWGVSHGAHTGPRDKSRMAGHPLSAGPRYHRGHAIPHTLGGLTDINLVAQLGSVNVGPFRRLEKLAVATPGALYFTYWEYGPTDSQTPRSVHQGFLRPGSRLEWQVHPN